MTKEVLSAHNHVIHSFQCYGVFINVNSSWMVTDFMIGGPCTTFCIIITRLGSWWTASGTLTIENNAITMQSWRTTHVAVGSDCRTA